MASAVPDFSFIVFLGSRRFTLIGSRIITDLGYTIFPLGSPDSYRGREEIAALKWS
ncbi:MAG: hypothetical protein K0R65_2440 [Crocinitomicaceae bacterium]|jgi:hypothetical protein|nr:hypothetical protein [Crocinitomicaceae bacterium]